MPKVTDEFFLTPAAIRNLAPGLYRDAQQRCLFLRVGKQPKRKGLYGAPPPKRSWYFQTRDGATGSAFSSARNYRSFT